MGSARQPSKAKRAAACLPRAKRIRTCLGCQHGTLDRAGGNKGGSKVGAGGTDVRILR